MPTTFFASNEKTEGGDIHSDKLSGDPKTPTDIKLDSYAIKPVNSLNIYQKTKVLKKNNGIIWYGSKVQLYQIRIFSFRED